MFSLEDFVLEESHTSRDCKLTYATCDELNEAKDNTILVTTSFPGMYQIMRGLYIGLEHALDPEKYTMVVANQIGNGLSTSPHNTPGTFASGLRFPCVRTGDDVAVQERLMPEAFGVEELALVVGGSMGAQQTYEWAVRSPQKQL